MQEHEALIQAARAVVRGLGAVEYSLRGNFDREALVCYRTRLPPLVARLSQELRAAGHPVHGWNEPL